MHHVDTKVNFGSQKLMSKIKVLSKQLSINLETLQPELKVTLVFPLELMQDNSVRMSEEKVYEYIGKEIEEAIKNFDNGE